MGQDEQGNLEVVLKGSLVDAINGGLKVVIAAMTGADTINNLLVVEERYQGLNITGNTQIKGAPGFVHSISFGQPTSAAPTAGVLTIYDSLSATGTIKYQHYFPNSQLAPNTIFLDQVFTTGIYASFVTLAGLNVSISYR